MIVRASVVTMLALVNLGAQAQNLSPALADPGLDTILPAPSVSIIQEITRPPNLQTFPDLIIPKPLPLNAPTFACSGALTSTIGANSLYNCGGNLSVTQGAIGADQSVTLQADGDVYLENLTVLTPTFNVYSGGTITQVGGLNPSGDVVMYGSSGSIYLTNPAGIVQTGALTPVGNTVITGGGSGALTTSSVPSVISESFLTAGSGTIPEPSTWALMALGLVGIAAVARRRA
jgi:hypothetical protein